MAHDPDESDEMPERGPNDPDEVDMDIAETMLGLQEKVFTIVVSYILRQPGKDAEEMMWKNLGTRVVTVTTDANADEAQERVEKQLIEHLTQQHAHAPWAVWTTAIFVGRPQAARVPRLEFTV